jgi:hypothetical protein
MPYVKQEDRDDALIPLRPGELNYKISTILDGYIRDSGLSYTTLNEIIGVLECAKMELYRRVAVPYEDVKLWNNGEVYHNAMSLMPHPNEKVQEQESPSKQVELFPDAK